MGDLSRDGIVDHLHLSGGNTSPAPLPNGKASLWKGPGPGVADGLDIVDLAARLVEQGIE